MPSRNLRPLLKLRTVVQELAKSAARKDHGTQWVRLELALILAEATGARLGAINGLRWSELPVSPRISIGGLSQSQ